jgi:hypothetical protein
VVDLHDDAMGWCHSCEATEIKNLGIEIDTTGNCGFANGPKLSQQPRPELLAKKLFPNRKTPLLGKKSSPTAQNPKTDGKVRLLAKGFFPNSIPVGKEQLLAKPQRG